MFVFANVLWLIRLLLITSAVSSCSEKCVDLFFVCVLHPYPESAKMGGHHQYTLWNAIESDVWPIDSHSKMRNCCLINVHSDLWTLSMAYLTFVVSGVWLLHRLDRIDRIILVAIKLWEESVHFMLKFMRLMHIRGKKPNHHKNTISVAKLFHSVYFYTLLRCRNIFTRISTCNFSPNV